MTEKKKKVSCVWKIVQRCLHKYKSCFSCEFEVWAIVYVYP